MKPIVCILAVLLSACAAHTHRTDAVFTHGVASGDMRGDSAVLWTRTREAARLVPELSPTPGFEAPTRLAPVEAKADSDFTVHATAKGLEPGSRYYYRFRAGDAASPVGSFRTPYAADDPTPVRLAFSGDADWKWKPYPLAAAIAQENVDFFFFLGDVIYETRDLKGETVARDLGEYRFKYRENRERRGNSASGMVPLRDLYAAFGQYSVFDNHEVGYGGDKAEPPYPEGGALSHGGFVNQTEGFRARIQAYLEYQPVRDEIVRGTGDARLDGTRKFFGAVPWGASVELIVLDDRSYRDERLRDVESAQARSCGRTMLGVPQREWFKRTLAAAQRRGAVWKVVVISSPMQELGTKSQVGFDLDSPKGWAGNYRCERDTLLKYIDEQRIDNVVFLTTDYHFTSVNNLTYAATPGDPASPRRPARNAFEVITGPIGAFTRSPLGTRVPVAGLETRAADAQILAALNGDLRKAGLDPVGLEAGFPGLDTASIRIDGKPGAANDPLAFATFAAYSYAVLTFDPSSVRVQVKSMPAVADPAALLDAANEKEYESRRPVEVLSFSVRAAPARP